jgi:ABC-type thiamine transport system ATPase subunit
MLQIVFDKNYSFKINMIQKENKIDVDFCIMKNIDGKEIEVRIDYGTCGGGLIDTISIGMKLVVKVLFKNVNSSPLVLDESFSALSKDKSKNLLLFLIDVCKRFDIQLIMVSHDPNVNDDEVKNKIDTLYEVKLKNNISEVTKLK